MTSSTTKMIMMNSNNATNSGGRSRGISRPSAPTQSSSSSSLLQANTSTQRQSSPSSSVVVGAVANPVVIIHQNQSVSTNLQPNATTVSSRNSNPQLNATNCSQNDDMMSELKYMKGYVNVLKERFTRKSLDSDHHSTLQPSASVTNTTSSSRFTNDYGRRRSVSPFIQYGVHTTSTHQSVKSKFTNPQSNPANHQNYVKERKLFASSDDLRHHNYRPTAHHYLNQYGQQYQPDVVRASRAGDSGKNGDQVVKCTYSNEINKDELPRPNFVSSVKNLFEKQLNATVGIVKSSSSSSHHQPQQPHQNTRSCSNLAVTSSTSSNSSHHVDLIDSARLKHNCTVVYEHSDNAPSSVVSSSHTISHSNPNGPESSSSQYIHMNGYHPSSKPYHEEVNSFSSKSNLDQPTDVNKPKKSADSKPLVTSKKPSTESMNGGGDANESYSPDKENNDVTSDPASANRILTFKERKEIFSKKQLQNSQLPNQISNSSPIKDPPVSNQTVKRIKIDDSPVENLASNQIQSNGEDKMITNGSKVKVGKKISTNGSVGKSVAPVANYVAQSINSIYNNNVNHDPTTDNNNNKTVEKEETHPAKVVELLPDEPAYMNHASDSTTDISADRIFEQQSQQAKLKAKSAVKMKTFYGGEEIKNIEQIQPPPLPPLPKNLSSNQSVVHVNGNGNGCNTNSSSSSIDYFNFEFVGAGIKLEKSILIVNSQSSNPNITFGEDTRRSSRNKNGNSLRVNFTDVAETYEYPSYEFLLKEMGIIEDEDEGTGININGDGDEYPYESSSDSITSQGNHLLTTSTTSFTQFLPGRVANRADVDDDDDEDDDDDDYPDSSHYNHIETGSSYSNGTNRNGYHRRRGEDADQEDPNGFYENFDTSTNKADNKFTKLGTFTNFKPSWHTVNYELGGVIENGSNHVRVKSAPNGNGELNGAGGDPVVVTRDILPSKDDEVKRWSCEMDSNILF